MTLPVFRLAPVLLSLAVLSSCDSQNDVQSTIPRNGATGVNPRSIVAIELSNSVSGADTNTTNSDNVLVTGDLTSGFYGGSLVLTRRKLLEPDMTVEEFKASGAGAQAAPPPGDDGSAEPDPNDTIVFLLADNTRFKGGENVKVFVSHDLTVHGTPIRRNRTINFRVLDDASSPDTLRVADASPEPWSLGVSPRPRIAATFSRPVKPDQLEQAIVIRGSQSGVHTGGETLQAQTDGTGRVREVVRRLAVDDSLIPGEVVDVTLSSAITEAATGASAAALNPHLLRFQARPAGAASRDGGDSWKEGITFNTVADPVATIAADFQPESPGTEIAVVGREAVGLHFQTATRSWTGTETPLILVDDEDEFTPVGATAYDVDGEGLPDLFVLLAGAQGSRLERFAANGSGTFEPVDEPIALAAPGALALAQADLDANGKPELIVTHPAGKRVKGQLSFFEFRQVPADPEDIDPTDPDSLLVERFERIENPVNGFELARRIAAEDFDSDGRIDLIADTGSALVFYRNFGSASAKFAFRSAGSLPGRGGGKLAPLAWVVSDLDQDARADVLAWDGAGALFYSDVGGDSFPAPEAVPSLPVLSLAAEALSLDADGDDRRDVILRATDGVSLILGGDDFPAGAERLELPAPSAAGAGAGAGRHELAAPGGAGVVLADLDGDTGLDVVAPSAEGIKLFFAKVVTPSVANPTTFRFAPLGEGTEVDGDMLRLAVVGDLTEFFGGYALALDHDESLLVYRGFEPPPDFLRGAQFTLCPDAELKGCAGNASARMSYLNQTKGSPADGVLLGTFLFEKASVAETKPAKVEFKSFPGPQNSTFRNTLALAEGGATADVEVSIGEPFLFDLEPPMLAAECSVTDRDEDTLDGLVTWSSPAGTPFPPEDFEFEIRVGTDAARKVPGTASSYEFTTGLAGVVPVVVAALRKTDGSAAATARCEVIGVHQPIVSCEASGENENRVSWSLSHAVEGFKVYRNGARIAELAGNVTQHVDRSPSATGGDIYEVEGVISDEEGPRGSCGPIGDPDERVLPPQITEAVLEARLAAGDPNSLRFRWTNAEGYEKITLAIEDAAGGPPLQAAQDFGGTKTRHTYDGEGAPGGVRPGRYVLSIRATVGSRVSDEVRSEAVSVPLPPLTVGFTCAVTPTGDVRLAWQKVWQGYTNLRLRIDHRKGGQVLEPPKEVTLAVEEQEHVITGVSPIGDYEYTLIAEYALALPDALKPPPASLERRCTLRFDPRVHVGSVDVGVGVRAAEIPVRADVFGIVNGFHFELEYPEFFTIDPGSGLRVEHPGAEIETFNVVNGGNGRKKAVVTVSGIETIPDMDGDGRADGALVLATLIGSMPLDFGLTRSSDLTFSGTTTLDFKGLGSTPVTTENGKLLVRRRFVAIDRAVIQAGSSEAVPLTVRTTFNAPASAPNYRLNAFQLHLKWDPALLEIVSASEEEQAGTVLVGKGTYFLPDDATLALARTNGELKVSWIGFNFTNPSKQSFLTPGNDMKILVARFRSKLTGTSPARFIPVEFVSDADAELPTAFFPEVDVPSEPDLEGFFAGGVQVLAREGPFAVESIAPARGALLGGNEAEIGGSGFPRGARIPEDLRIRFERASGAALAVDVLAEDLLSVEANRIRFRVPDSTLRLPQANPVRFTVKVTAGVNSAALESAYSYDPPAVTGSDLRRGQASGGEVMAILGTGIPSRPAATVGFKVPGVATPFPASVTSISADGTRLLVLTPDLRGHETKNATVEVSMGTLGKFTVPGGFEILRDGTPAGLRLTGVEPAEGTICGGLEVLLRGEGFLPGLQVSFGQIPAAEVELVDGRSARVTTPAVAEGTGPVTISAVIGAGERVNLGSPFRYLPAAPPFLRGDVNEDGAIGITDVILLADLILGKGDDLPANLDAADANDDGAVNGGDVTRLMNALFGGGDDLPPPFPPGAAALDPTPDALTSCP